MKFKVNVKEFVRALDASHEVATKNFLKEFPYAEKITLKAEKDKITVYAFGGVVSNVSCISNDKNHDMKYECEEEGIVTVSSKSFSSYLDTFPPQEEIEISLDKKNFLKMALISNKKENCGTPVYEEHVEPFKFAEKFSQNVNINREVFLKGFNKVLFGATDIEKYYYYHCIAMEVKDRNIMFSSGTGSRFVIDIFEGDCVLLDAVGEMNIKIPSKYASTIKKIIENSHESYINIKYSKGDEALAIPEQIVFDLGWSALYIKDIAKFDNYPSLSSVLTNKYDNRVSCDLKDWMYPIKRIMATFNDHNEDIHNTEIKVQDEKIIWKTKTKIEATGNVPIDFEGSDIKKEPETWFCANSVWLSDMASCNARSGKIDIFFNSQEYLNQDNLSQENIKKFRKKPVLVKYMEDKETLKNIVEQFYLFFVVAS